jgi:hypothetical protein
LCPFSMAVEVAVTLELPHSLLCELCKTHEIYEKGDVREKTYETYERKEM